MLLTGDVQTDVSSLNFRTLSRPFPSLFFSFSVFLNNINFLTLIIKNIISLSNCIYFLLTQLLLVLLRYYYDNYYKFSLIKNVV